MKRDKTDWNIYYTKPKSKISTITQKYTLNYLLKEINIAGLGDGIRILEFGGGNSCFAAEIREKLSISKYDVVDNCKVALDKLKNSLLVDMAWDFDLCENIECLEMPQKYNLVYSVGLVEHFSESERKRVIQNHFACCVDGGVVLITAPTPTFKYRIIRKIMELLKVWQFWDECPICLEQLVDEMKSYGEIIDSGINYTLPLTQAVVMCRKK